MKALIITAFIISAFAEVTNEERDRIQDYLTRLSGDVAVLEVFKHNIYNDLLDLARVESGKIGKCVDEAVKVAKKSGNETLECGYGACSAVLRKIGDSTQDLDPEFIEYVKNQIDSGELSKKLEEFFRSVQNLLDRHLAKLKRDLEKCQKDFNHSFE